MTFVKAGLPLGVKFVATFLAVVGLAFLAGGLGIAGWFVYIAFAAGGAAIAGAIGLLKGERWGWLVAVSSLAVAILFDVLTFGPTTLIALVLHGVTLGYLLSVRKLFVAPVAEPGVWMDAQA